MNKEQLEELDRLREYEKATRDTICWGVSCIHEAWALNMISQNESEISELKEEIARLKNEIDSMREK